ncbi:hypothetical protein PCANC_04796 [Puccinia coronata f. sp. avenae]|uniref:Uncharacterized protein n=1 Tax=Puccinia coronata f. sp. avenae TaxID=200324 RepID=A0A2N5VWN5_9BASI|nr:hypothetical protein PCANC_04796 [Puccinia coronata f. sp. avenae]
MIAQLTKSPSTTAFKQNHPPPFHRKPHSRFTTQLTAKANNTDPGSICSSSHDLYPSLILLERLLIELASSFRAVCEN